ncbi:DUF7002 family protein [Micromonospora vinacea]|uniref:DUF7002 family protein n=1 Tax=Micromonospora vinacea TaxID=709878 RepID=UPI003D8E6800
MVRWRCSHGGWGLETRERDRLLSAPRKRSTALRAPGLPPAVIRDQKPMKFIAEKIDPGSSLAEYLAAINPRVFFWASAERLERLRQAKEYRTENQGVLHVDIRALVEVTVLGAVPDILDLTDKIEGTID